MMDGVGLTEIGVDMKYGRVFVEHGPESANPTEPLFILRAQDKLAVPTIGQYQVKAIEAEMAHDFVTSVDEVIERFSDFKMNNQEQMKLPD